MFNLKNYQFAQEYNQSVLEEMNRNNPRTNNSIKDYEVCSENFSIKVQCLSNTNLISVYSKQLNKVLEVVHADNPKEVISKYITLAFGTI